LIYKDLEMRNLIVAFILCAFTMSSQTYSYYITDYKNGVPSTMLGVPGDQFKSTITFTNPGSGPINLHIKRTQKTIPSYWSLWYHFTQSCSPSQDTITVKVPPFSSSLLTLHFKTDSVTPGVANASFKMYQLGYEDDAETFNLSASTNLAAQVGIRTEVLSSDIRIFPNPANHILNITSTEQNITSIAIYNALGVEKFKSDRVTQKHAVNISEYPAGVYFVKVADGNTTHLHKIIIKN
jgi:hypothetical protein